MKNSDQPSSWIPVGYKALVEQLGLKVLPHYRDSYIAKHGRGKTIIHHEHEIHIYPKTYALQNEQDIIENLEFGLKYDGLNLEIIKALFEKIDKEIVTNYVSRQPTGIYARKIWYLYEFMMNTKLNLKDSQRIKYVDLLDQKKYFTANPIKSPRHAINDNLLGNDQFCPIVRKTEILEKYIKQELDLKVKALLKKYDPHLIARACNYLYTKETMSSYQIEREQPDKNRLVRFINMLQQAPLIELLSKDKLIELQNIIVDPRFKNLDYRFDQNYVGENLNPYFQNIHYIPPKAHDVEALMIGLLKSLDRMLTSEIHPVIIGAAISFGFVFIHPFEDGNGRIHRFLIHYILSKKDFTPRDMIFPVSSIMLQNMHEYDKALETFSKPLLAILTDYDLSNDGTMSVNQTSKQFYQYIDFTSIAEYLFSCIHEAIYNYIEREIKFLLHYDQAKSAIQSIIDMPDKQIDLFIKFVMQNSGKLSEHTREKYFSQLTHEEIIDLTAIVNEVMLEE